LKNDGETHLNWWAWWKLNKPDVGPYFPEWVDSEIAGFDPNQNLQMLEQNSVHR